MLRGLTMLENGTKLITALVCTRNRGTQITGTLTSILACTHPQFELIVVDQSENSETEEAVAPFLSDPRLRYLRSREQGLGRARNVGLAESRAEIVVMTDDDCEVPPYWLETMAAVFAENPTVAVAFCSVAPAAHDSQAGFIPAYQRPGRRLLSGPLSKCKARGIGAGISVRRVMALEMGGFDVLLGSGGQFPSCEDGDMAVRALLKGYGVYETDAVAVQHSGYRTWTEGKMLARRDWVAIGAAYSKPLKCGHWRFAVVPAYEFSRHALWPPLSDLLHGRKPRGLGRILAFVQGFVQGWKTPVDPKTLLFRLPKRAVEKAKTEH